MTAIEKWLRDPSVERFTDNKDNIYGIRIIGPGENLFFQENDKGLICNIDAIGAIIYSASISRWNDSEKMNQAEKERVLKLIAYYYKTALDSNVEISHKFSS